MRTVVQIDNVLARPVINDMVKDTRTLLQQSRERMIITSANTILRWP